MGTLHPLGFVASLSLLLVAAVACGGDSDGAGAGADTATADGGADDNATATSLEEVCAAGVDEGPSPIGPRTRTNWQRVADAFVEAYPGIDIDFLSLRDEETTQRILTSVSAGQSPDPDLISNDLASQLRWWKTM